MHTENTLHAPQTIGTFPHRPHFSVTHIPTNKSLLFTSHTNRKLTKSKVMAHLGSSACTCKSNKHTATNKYPCSTTTDGMESILIFQQENPLNNNILVTNVNNKKTQQFNINQSDINTSLNTHNNYTRAAQYKCKYCKYPPMKKTKHPSQRSTTNTYGKGNNNNEPTLKRERSTPIRPPFTNTNILCTYFNNNQKKPTFNINQGDINTPLNTHNYDTSTAHYKCKCCKYPPMKKPKHPSQRSTSSNTYGKGNNNNELVANPQGGHLECLMAA